MDTWPIVGDSNILTLVLVIILTIFLGALGSGFWNVVLDPLTRNMLRWLTLGVRSIRDRTYSEIAKGRHESAGRFLLLLLLVLVMLMLGASFGEVMVTFNPSKDLINIRDQLNKDLSVDELETLRDEINSIVGRSKKLLLLVKTIFFLFLTFFVLFQFLVISYKIAAIAHFNQCYQICLPYLGDKLSKYYRAKFASIKKIKRTT